MRKGGFLLNVLVKNKLKVVLGLKHDKAIPFKILATVEAVSKEDRLYTDWEIHSKLFVFFC